MGFFFHPNTQTQLVSVPSAPIACLFAMAKPTEPPKYKHRYTLYAHSMAVTALKFSLDGVHLASACKTRL
jgi:hypothetical protein